MVSALGLRNLNQYRAPPPASAITSTTSSKPVLYEQYTSGELARHSYLERKKAVDEKVTSTAEKIDTLETAVAELEAADTNHETAFEQSCNTFFGETALSYESAHAFVKAVCVFSDKRVEIHWKFKDVVGEIYQA